ncbi:TPA: hypothetical protein HA251_06200 [Candidatus Woesearchaeota archaeon]|nr:hypothetical protein [Candidatus Woesearchaeota archaeon]
MLLIIATTFVLYSAFFIGWQVSRSVPDEVPRATRYVDNAIDALLIITIGTAIYTTGNAWLAIGISAAIIALRAITHIDALRAPLSGIACGVALYNAAITPVILCLVLNYLIGTRAKKSKSLFFASIAQPALAIITAAIAIYAFN